LALKVKGRYSSPRACVHVVGDRTQKCPGSFSFKFKPRIGCRRKQPNLMTTFSVWANINRQKIAPTVSNLTSIQDTLPYNAPRQNTIVVLSREEAMEIRESYADRNASWLAIVVAWALVIALFAGLAISQIIFNDLLHWWALNL
jgi:hypothetical protein